MLVISLFYSCRRAIQLIKEVDTMNSFIIQDLSSLRSCIFRLVHVLNVRVVNGSISYFFFSLSLTIEVCCKK